MDRGHLFRMLIDADTPEKLWLAAKSHIQEKALHFGGADPLDVLYSSESVVLFGAGHFSRTVLDSWAGDMPKVRCIVDSNPGKWGKTWCGLPVLCPSELSDSLRGSLVVIAVMDTHEIENQLESINTLPLFAEHDGSVGYVPGHWLLRHQSEFHDVYLNLADNVSRDTFLAVSKARIFQRFHFPMKGNWFTAECSSHPQYFPNDIIELNENESFLDCGAYDGDTIIDFASRMWRGNFKTWHAIALEADASNAKLARNNLDAFGLDTVPVHHGVLGTDTTMVNIHNCRDTGVPQSGMPIRLEDIPWEAPPTYIKLDIEGAELNTIQAASRMLSRYMPKLAVCLYHKTSDLLNIPMQIRAEHPFYDLYIRHHRAGSLWETVCYAVPDREALDKGTGIS